MFISMPDRHMYVNELCVGSTDTPIVTEKKVADAMKFILRMVLLFSFAIRMFASISPWVLKVFCAVIARRISASWKWSSSSGSCSIMAAAVQRQNIEVNKLLRPICLRMGRV